MIECCMSQMLHAKRVCCSNAMHTRHTSFPLPLLLLCIPKCEPLGSTSSSDRHARGLEPVFGLYCICCRPNTGSRPLSWLPNRSFRKLVLRAKGWERWLRLGSLTAQSRISVIPSIFSATPVVDTVQPMSSRISEGYH